MKKFSYNEALKSIAPWDQTENEIRHRVRNPHDFIPDSFRSKVLDGVTGMSVILAKLKPEKVPAGGNPDAMVLQAYRFDKKSWTLKRAKKWVESHRANKSMARLMHTKRIVCGELTAVGEVVENKPRTFDFILCHVGMNKNGDYFTQEELEQNHQTIVGSKADLQHSQNLSDIVGKVVLSAFTGGVVSGRAELYKFDSADQAYNLLKDKFIKAVSMECDYQRGTCSICGKVVSNKTDYCNHLKNYKGSEYKGAQVYETLEGVKFTGVGLLENKGADPMAVITAVSDTKCKCQTHPDGRKTMEPIEIADKTIADLKKELDDMRGSLKTEAAKVADTLKKTVADLTKEKEELAAQVADLEKTIKENKTATEATAKTIKEFQEREQKAKAEARVKDHFTLLAKKGIEVAEADLEDRRKKIAAMDDGAYESLVNSIGSLPDAKADKNGDDKSKAKTDANDKNKKTMKTSAKANDQDDTNDSDNGLDDAFGFLMESGK